MAILSKSLTLPLLFIFSLPVTLFAVFTTCLAVSVLLFRFTLIYIDLALAVIPHYLLGGSNASKYIHPFSSQSQSLPSPPQPSYRRRKRRTSSSSSYSAAESITPIGLTHSMTDPQAILTSPNSCIGLNTSIGPTRDFEGVGGWRMDNPSEEEEGLWTKINSRLELPADHGRRHKRSLTSGSLPTPNNMFSGAGLGMAEVKRGRRDEETPGMAMNTGRARTPPTTNLGGAGAGQEKDAFEKGVLMMGVSGKGKASSNGSTGSSGSSKSSGLSMKGR